MLETDNTISSFCDELGIAKPFWLRWVK
jgi:hypothetical protein